MIRRLLPLSLAVVLIGTACSNDVDRDVLAVVNGEEITTEEFIAVYAAGGAAPLSSVGLSDPETSAEALAIASPISSSAPVTSTV